MLKLKSVKAWAIADYYNGIDGLYTEEADDYCLLIFKNKNSAKRANKELVLREKIVPIKIVFKS